MRCRTARSCRRPVAAPNIGDVHLTFDHVAEYVGHSGAPVPLYLYQGVIPARPTHRGGLHRLAMDDAWSAPACDLPIFASCRQQRVDDIEQAVFTHPVEMVPNGFKEGKPWVGAPICTMSLRYTGHIPQGPALCLRGCPTRRWASKRADGSPFLTGAVGYIAKPASVMLESRRAVSVELMRFSLSSQPKDGSQATEIG